MTEPKETIIRTVDTDILGVPLPIIPSEDFPSDIHHESLSKHHGYFYLGSKKYGSVSGKALRGSNILRAQKAVHNSGQKSLHRFYDQSPGPADSESRFLLGLLGAAIYVPERGIDLWSGEPVVRDLEEGELAILHEVDPQLSIKGKNLFYYDEEMRAFFEQVVVNQDLNKLDNEKIGRFAKDLKLKSVRDLGHEILAGAVTLATNPVAETYRLAYENGRLLCTAPENPDELVLKVLGREDQRERLFRPLRSQIARLALKTEIQKRPIPVAA